jgi:choline dehydrogenase-like flavoprotein
MIYMRGQAADYDGWRQTGCAGWGWDDVLPYFKRHEDWHAGADEMHGAGGEWRVEEQRLSWEILDAFAEACAAAGIPRTDDFNRGDNSGVSWFRVNQRRGWRWTAADGFLRPARRRQNLRIETGALVERVRIEEGRATGVVYTRAGGRREARARASVVLAAGAIGSPHILQRSGIGPAEWLREAGVEVLRDMPGVGANLQDHLQLRCVWRVSGVQTLNTRAKGLFGKAGIALEYALFRRGPMAMAPSQLGAFARSSEEVATPDLEYHVQPLSLEAFGEPLHDFPAFTASICHLRPSSRGTVRLASPDAAAHPEIRPNYLSTEDDRLTAARALRLTRRIVAGAPLARYAPQEVKPGTEVGDDDAALAAAAGRIGTTIFHPVGTARMGSDPEAVVDPRLRLHGIEGLRVIDASVMPRITSGNTASPVLMIAEKGAEMLLEDTR